MIVETLSRYSPELGGQTGSWGDIGGQIKKKIRICS